LVKTVAGRYWDRLARDVEQAFTGGMRAETLAERFEERDGMLARDALRLARDQVAKLTADFNQERQEALGVTGYVWRTMNDNRVRPEHVPREGQHFDWDAPPEDGHPGQPIQCRCYSEPNLSDLLSPRR
jgi:SPP1 gp7 family putative phage head morphogenesis protein